MSKIYELGVVGLGPAGIGAVLGVDDSNVLKNTICFESGNSIDLRQCNILANSNECCSSDYCQITSGIGGASIASGGKISHYPAGSGLKDFLGSAELTKARLSEAICFLEKKIQMKKVDVSRQAIENALDFYKKRGVDYKYYDVYEFDTYSYIEFINSTISMLIQKGANIELNTDVVSIAKCANGYEILTLSNGIEKSYQCRKVIVATGNIRENIFLSDKCQKRHYDIGFRIEGTNAAFKDMFDSHGDLKLKYENGRTYCTARAGKVLAYLCNGMYFLEGYVELNDLTGYTNLALLVRREDEMTIHNTYVNYKDKFNGIPIKQSYYGYMNNKQSEDCFSTLAIATQGCIADLFPESLNNELKVILKYIFEDTLCLDAEELTIIAPELKVINQLVLSQKFAIDEDYFVVGAATGKFRGILQSFCSGLVCGEQIRR